jgi:hypothetical protein
MYPVNPVKTLLSDRVTLTYNELLDWLYQPDMPSTSRTRWKSSAENR